MQCYGEGLSSSVIVYFFKHEQCWIKDLNVKDEICQKEKLNFGSCSFKETGLAKNSFHLGANLHETVTRTIV